jgi:hypothetical protein
MKTMETVEPGIYRRIDPRTGTVLPKLWIRYPGPGADTVRTTLDLPLALWKRAKTRALDERRDLRAVLLDALRAYLGTPVRRKDTP